MDELRCLIGDELNSAVHIAVITVEPVGDQVSEIIGHTLFCGYHIVGIVADDRIEIGCLLDGNHRVGRIKRNQHALHIVEEGSVRIRCCGFGKAACINGEKRATAFLAIDGKLRPIVKSFDIRVLKNQVPDRRAERNLVVHHRETDETVHLLTETGVVAAQAMKQFVRNQTGRYDRNIFKVFRGIGIIPLQNVDKGFNKKGSEVNLVLMREATRSSLVFHITLDEDDFIGLQTDA